MTKAWRLGLATLLIAGAAAVPAAPETDEEIISRLKAGFESSGRREDLLNWNARERRVGFANIEKVYPARKVPASTKPYPLVSRPVDLSDVTYVVGDEYFTLADFTRMPQQIGLIVLSGDEILFERYAPGMSRDTPWMSFSITKSITSLLFGIALRNGYIASLQEPVTRYLPRLRETGYQGVTIEHLLTMTSGIAWDEKYADPGSDVAKAGALNGLDLIRYLAGQPRVAAPGTLFNYSTAETNLAGEVLRAAIGNNASEMIRHHIWQPFGMSSDAWWGLAKHGEGELGGCCLAATLRDYARIGRYVAAAGVLPDGTITLGSDWMTRSTSPSAASPRYGYLWWLREDGYAAAGIYGQMIRIDPVSDVVIAVQSNADEASGTVYHQHLRASVEAIRQHLSAR